MKFVTHEAVNILQNTHRSVKKIDIVYALVAAYLSVYPGRTMFKDTTGWHKFGHFPRAWIYYIKCESNGNASAVWDFHCYIQTSVVNGITCIRMGGVHQSSTFTAWSGPPESMHPQLQIALGEVKILLECSYCYHYHSFYSFSDGRNCGSVLPREAFGFLVSNPKEYKGRYNNGEGNYFDAVVVFTPKSGLFSSSIPS
ncbi:MAG: hypothetical protein LBB21_04840 [Holosporaceae bacterium]|jgi:hypothetical protein|nr:hypothetical protein [Holosporaceae bacterium]